MILSIDVGNSNIVLGGIDDGGVRFTERLSTNSGRTEIEYAIDIKNVLEIHSIPFDAIEGGIISSVVPQVTDVLKAAVEKLIGRKVKIVGPGLKTGLNIRIDNPATLGSDLLVDSVAAVAEHPLPLVVIDLGTATTLCIINQNREYIGGIVTPGVRTALDSLVERTSLLQQISLDPPKKTIGTNTMDAMRSGILFGSAAMIDGLADRIEREVGSRCTLVATGGLSRLIIPLCSHRIIIDDDLLLKGLKIIYEKNK